MARITALVIDPDEIEEKHVRPDQRRRVANKIRVENRDWIRTRPPRQEINRRIALLVATRRAEGTQLKGTA